jgi:hypothetical protein
MDELMVDGNAIAGLLQEVFAIEMTTALGTCGNCGAAEPVGAIHVYRGAGIVLRCPHCNNVLAKIVKNEALVWDRPSGRPNTGTQPLARPRPRARIAGALCTSSLSVQRSRAIAPTV